MSAHTHLSDFVKQWSLEGRLPIGATPDSDESFEDILRQIVFMDGQAYSRFVPSLYSTHSPAFEDRMVKWLQNPDLTDSDKVALFQFILRLAYFSFDDYISLYKMAYSSPISRWVWEQASLSMDTPNFSERLETERSRHTWYASITDSLIISEFYHANSIAGIKCRPNFLTLSELGDSSRIKPYMQCRALKRIVLLEDFVGSGQQSEGIINWALANTDVPILFCPMLICPDGIRRLLALAASSGGRLKMDPVIRLGDSAFLSSHDRTDPVMNYVSDLAERIHSNVAGSCPSGSPPYSSHGYHLPGDTHTGATIVMFSNSPDNTMPLVHFHSPKSVWEPVFPRVSRETL